MQNDSGNTQESLNEDFTPEDNSQSLSHKVRVYTRILTGVCVSIWIASFLAYLGAEWLYTLQKPEYVKIVPRPPPTVTLLLRSSGSLALLVGIGGWWAAITHRHGFLFTFSCITLLTSVVEISCGSVTLSYLGKTALLMYEDVVRDLEQIRKSDANETTDKFLELQKKLQCCGVSSYRDWIESPWWKTQRKVNSNFVIPQSCCINTFQDKNCHTGTSPFKELDYPKLVHKEGCMVRVSSYMNYLFYISGCLALVGGLLKFAGFFTLHYLVNMILTYQQLEEENVIE